MKKSAIKKLSEYSSSENSSKLVKIGEASQLIGVSIDTLRRWEKRGWLNVTKTPGGTRLYDKEQLQRLNPNLRRGPKSLLTPLAPFSSRLAEASSEGGQISLTSPISQTSPLPQTQGISLSTDQPILKTMSSLKTKDFGDETEDFDLNFNNNQFGSSVLNFFRASKISISALVVSFILLSSLIIPFYIASNYLKENQKLSSNPLIQSSEIVQAVANVISPDLSKKFFGTHLPAGWHGPPDLLSGNLADFLTPASERDSAYLEDNAVLSLSEGSPAKVGQVLAESSPSGSFLEVNLDTVVNGLLSANEASVSGTLAVNKVLYTFPTAQGEALTFLQNDGAGTLAWTTVPQPGVATTTTTGIASFSDSFFTVSSAGTVALKEAGITTTEIKNGTISNSDLSSSSITISTSGTLTGGGSVSLGGSITLTGSETGDISAVTVGNGLSGGGSSGAVTIDLDVTTSSTTTTTSSNSGLETASDGLSLLRGCADTEVLKWSSGSSLWACGSGGGSFTLAGDSGTSQTISASDTLTVAGGTNGIDTAAGATDTITLNLDTTEIGTSTFGSGSSLVWTFNTGTVDPTIDFNDGSLILNEAGADIDFRIEGDNNANLFTLDAGLFSGVGQISLGAAAQGTATAFTVIDNPAITATSNQNFYKAFIDNSAAVTITGATTSSLVASLTIDEPNISAAGTVTNAATLYLSGAPTEGSSGNFAVWVDNGESRFENTPVSGSSTGSALTVVPSYVVEVTDLTLSGLRVAFDTNSNTDSGDTAYGVNIDDITTAAGPTEYGLRVGTGYDYPFFFDFATRDLRLSVVEPSAGTSPLTLTVPSVAADDTFCIKTLSNCFGAGASGVTYTSQTTNAVTKFTANAGEITSSGLLDDGSTFTFSANRAISMTAGTGSFTQAYQPSGSTGTANAHSITSTFGIDTTDQTLSGIFVDADTNGNGDSGDILYGVNIDTITASSATEYGLGIGSGYDTNLLLNDTTTRVAVADGGTITILDSAGNTLCTVTDNSTVGDLSCTGNITGGSSGTSGFWTRTSTTLSPATANDVVSIANTNTTGSDFAITNTGIYTGTGLAAITANSATSGDLLTISGTALTSGSALVLTGPSGGTAGVTDAGLKITSDVGNIGTSNGLISSTATIDSTANAISGVNLYLSTTSSQALGTTVGQDYYGIRNILTKSGADTTSGTINSYGTYSTATNTGGDTAGTRNTYGGYFVATGDTSGTTTTYGVYADANAGDTSYGVYIDDGAGTTDYGIYQTASTDDNYFAGFSGFGTDTTPDFALEVEGTEGTTLFSLTTGDGVISDGSLAITDDDNATSLSLTNNTATTVGAGVNTDGIIDFSSTSISTGNLVNIENTTSLSSGRLLNITTTSTALTSGNLLRLDWTPGSATTATGDLFTLNIGANGTTTGNLFNILDAGSSIFSVSETSFTTSLPSQFNSAGDVEIAYDLNFTNPTASYINSLASLTLKAGEPFNSSDLTLQTYNQGTIVFNTATTTGTSLDYTNSTLTTGTAFSLTSSNSSQTTATVLGITQSGVTTGYTGNLINISSTSTTGAATFFNLAANSSTVGTLMAISGDALTTGIGLAIDNGSSAMTTGSLLRVTAGGTGAVATNGIVGITHSGAYTSTSNAGLLNVTATGLVGTGTVVNIGASNASQLTDTLLNVAQTGVTTGYTGTAISFSTTATTGSGAKLLDIAANAMTVGDVVTVSGTALTTGSLLTLTGPSGGTAGVTDAGLKITSDVGNIGTSNGLISSTAVFDGTTATGVNLYLTSSDAIAAANVDYGIYNSVTNTGAIDSAIIKTSYGNYTSVSSTLGAPTTAGTTNVYGNYITTTATHAADFGTVNNYGLYIANGTSSTNGTSTKYGINIDDQSGADTNIDLNFTGSPIVRIGDAGVLTFTEAGGNNTLCTLTDATNVGNLSCTGNITGSSSGTVGFWSRSSTTLSPATANDIVSIATTNTTGADLAITNTGVYTGTGIFNLTANSADTGTLAALSGDALTTGIGLAIDNGTSAMTTGSLLRVTAGGTGAIATNGIVGITHAGAYTSTSNAGLLNVTASGLVGTGTVVNIGASNASQLTNTLLNVAQTGVTTGYTGNVVNITGTGTTGAGNVVNIANNVINGTGTALNVNSSTTGALTTGLAYFNASAAHTGNVLAVNSASTAGTGVAITDSAAGQTTTTLLSVASSGYTTGYTGNVATFTGTGTTGAGNVVNITNNAINGSGTGLNVNSSTTGALTNGLVYVNASAAHTGNALGVSTATATGIGISVTANSLTTGSGIAVSSSGTIASGGELLSLSGTGITSGRLLDISSAANTLTTGQLVNIASSATSISGSTTTGSLLTSTATGVLTSTFVGNLNYFSWEPGSAATAAGDIFRINIGTNGTTTGNLFNVTDANSSIFAVSETAFTTSLPSNFTSSGDVSVAYDLAFTNPTASTITSAAPLSITAGESFNSSNLTLKTYNQGSIVFDVANTTTTALSISNSTVNTGDIFNISATAITTGQVLDIAGSTSVGATGNFVNIATDVGSAGSLMNLAPDFSGSAVTGSGLKVTATDSTANANTDYAINSVLTISGNVAKTVRGIRSEVISSSNVGDTIGGIQSLITHNTGTSSGNKLQYGFLTNVDNSGVTDAAGTHAIYGGHFVAAGNTGGTSSTYGIYADANAGDTSYGVYIDDGAGTTDYGLYQAGASDDNFFAGNIGLIGAAASNVALNMTGNNLDSTAQYGVFSDLTYSSAGTGEAEAGRFRVNTAAAAYTLTAARAIHILNAVKGASSAITNNYGLYVDAMSGGATINDAIFTAGGRVLFTCTTSGTTWTTAQANPSCSDYAEVYDSSDSSLNPGDLVTIDPDHDGSVKKSNGTPYQKEVVGVYSTSPGMLIGDGQIIQASPDEILSQGKVPVALTGKVPVRATTENGPIHKGDFLTASSIPGYVMKATGPGITVGRALEDYTDNSVQGLLVFVNVTYADPNDALASLLLDQNGTLITQTSPTSLTVSGEITVGGAVAAGGFMIDSAKINRVGALASLPVSDSKVSLADAVNALNQGIQSSEFRIQNLESKDASNSAQIAAAQQLSNEAIQQSLSLDEKVASTSANLAFLSQQIQDLLDSSDVIPSDSEGSIDSSSSTQNDNLELTPPDDLMMATDSATLANLNITDKLSTLNLQSSAFQALDATISGTLKSLGETFFGNTIVAGDFSIDGTLSMTGSSINSIACPVIPSASEGSIDSSPSVQNDSSCGVLFIQNSPLASGVDFFNGLVTISKDGILAAKEVVADQFKVSANSSAGTATMAAGETEIWVPNTLVEANSIIIITPESDTALPLIVKYKVPGFGFTAGIAAPPANDINFSYLIVGQEAESQ